MEEMEVVDPEAAPKRRSLSMLSNLLDDLGFTKVTLKFAAGITPLQWF